MKTERWLLIFFALGLFGCVGWNVLCGVWGWEMIKEFDGLQQQSRVQWKVAELTGYPLPAEVVAEMADYDRKAILGTIVDGMNVVYDSRRGKGQKGWFQIPGKNPKWVHCNIEDKKIIDCRRPDLVVNWESRVSGGDSSKPEILLNISSDTKYVWRESGPFDPTFAERLDITGSDVMDLDEWVKNGFDSWYSMY